MSVGSAASTALNVRATAQQQAQQLMAQQGGRPNVRAGTPQARGQMEAGLAASGWSSIGHLAQGASIGNALGRGFMSPVGLGLMMSNPRARAAQMAADRVYLGTSKKTPYISARSADVTKGGLKDVKVRKVSSQVGLVEKTSMLPGFTPDPDRIWRKLTQKAQNLAEAEAIRDMFPPPPPLTVQQRIDEAIEADKLKRTINEAVEAARPVPTPLTTQQMIDAAIEEDKLKRLIAEADEVKGEFVVVVK